MPTKTRKSTRRPATASEILDHQVRSLAAPRVRGASTQEQGASGTTNIGGYITGEEYNAKLDGKRGIAVYDEMRRSSAQVQASLAVLKVPIQSARPVFTAPKDGDTTDQAIADACTRMLLGDAKQWTTTLNHLLLRLDFGCSALEKVWMLDKAFRVGDRVQTVIRPLRLAPRLPSTFERFIADENGQLKTLVQVAMKNGHVQQLPIPAEDLVFTVHQQEGDNLWGRGVLRTSYMHWFYLTQAYRIGAVRLDRFGVGVPIAELGENHKASKTELNKIEKLLKALRVHEKAYFMLPHGVAVRIMVPDGKGGIDELPAVEHHSAMIARNVLAGFILEGMSGGDAIGSTRTETLKDFFSSALENVAMDLAADLRTQLVEPFCAMNFNMAGREAPTLTFTDLTDVDTKELAENLNTLAQKDYITPDDDIEDLLRKLMKLPQLREDQKGRPRGRAAVADPGDTGTPQPASKTAPATKNPGKTSPPNPNKPLASRALARHTDPLTGRLYSRTPTETESAFFALREVPDRLELETQDLIAALTAIRLDQLTQLATQLAKKDARDTAAFTDLRPSEVKLTGRADLERAIRATQARMAAYGAFQVRQELARQGAPVATALRSRESYWAPETYDGHHAVVFALATPRTDPTAGASGTAAKSSLVSSAKVTAEKLLSTWKLRILEVAIRLRRTGLQGDALVAAILAELQPDIAASVKADATGEVNEAFALGRATEASAQQEIISTVIYSALMDVNTCEPCGDLDKEEMAYGSDRYFETMPPYRHCEGNKGRPDACRCVHLFLYRRA